MELLFSGIISWCHGGVGVEVLAFDGCFEILPLMKAKHLKGISAFKFRREAQTNGEEGRRLEDMEAGGGSGVTGSSRWASSLDDGTYEPEIQKRAKGGSGETKKPLSRDEYHAMLERGWHHDEFLPEVYWCGQRRHAQVELEGTSRAGRLSGKGDEGQSF